MNNTYIILLFLFLPTFSFTQVIVQPNFNLEYAEKDSATTAKIEASLNAFLSEAQNRTYSHEYVDSTHRKKYEFFFHKLAGIGKSKVKDYHAPLVLKSYSVEEGAYRLTVAFTGERDGNPFVFQVTELKAVPYQEHFRFYCPFEENTSTFKTKQFDNITYHFSGSIDEKKALEFVEMINTFAEMSGGEKPILDYYSFQSLDELLKSYGFLYSARQCNFLCYDLGFTDNDGQVFMTGTDNENYIFGYIGDYLYYHLPNASEIYTPFMRGMATYYGGYGLKSENMEILKGQFREELEKRPDINFLEEWKKGRKSSVHRHFSYYVMSAFLYEEALKKQDFKKALQLVYSGEDGSLFFENLKEVMSVDEESFHETIVRLIQE